MNTKRIAGFLLGSAILAAPFIGLAQTPPASAASLIETLRQQVAALQAKIDELRRAQSGAAQAAQDVRGTLKLISKLREGMSGEEVRLLQTVLAGDPDVYPEGLISGFFGKLTAKAIKKFQKKHGLEQVGNVGPKTLKKLNEFLEKHPVKAEGDDDDDEDDNRGKKKGHKKRFCAIIPPGHLIAPGWLRKHDGEIQIVPPCQDLPPGIEKKLRGTTTPPVATTTPPAPPPPPPPPPPPSDTTAPVISSVTAVEVTSSSAKIRWVTNESASSKVWYATSTPILAQSPTSMVATSTLVADHSVMLETLTASSTYYYKVSSTDAANNTSTSDEFNFTTQ